MILRVLLIILFLSLAWAGWAICAPHRERYETAPYTVVSRSGDFELRDYPALSLATSRLDGPRSENRGFGSLFGYISGKNVREEKIAMTTPVFVDPDRMSFVLPGKVAEGGAPAPAERGVVLGIFPGGRYAAMRFSGGRSGGKPERAEKALRDRMAAEGLPAVGPAIFAYYDPPFTLPFLRRNEVLLRLE